eukprot:gene23595-biopygen2056
MITIPKLQAVLQASCFHYFFEIKYSKGFVALVKPRAKESHPLRSAILQDKRRNRCKRVISSAESEEDARAGYNHVSLSHNEWGHEISI